MVRIFTLLSLCFEELEVTAVRKTWRGTHHFRPRRPHAGALQGLTVFQWPFILLSVTDESSAAGTTAHKTSSSYFQNRVCCVGCIECSYFLIYFVTKIPEKNTAFYAAPSSHLISGNNLISRWLHFYGKGFGSRPAVSLQATRVSKYCFLSNLPSGCEKAVDSPRTHANPFLGGGGWTT